MSSAERRQRLVDSRFARGVVMTLRSWLYYIARLLGDWNAIAKGRVGRRIGRREGEEPFQLTRTVDGSSSSPAWSPNGKWIAFSANRGDDSQIFLISPHGGEAWPLTEQRGKIAASVRSRPLSVDSC